MKQNKFWFYIEKELPEITEDLKISLYLPDYYSDYEDTWEWCEAVSRDLNGSSYFNISREHNWKHGKYECPVLLLLKNLPSNVEEQGELITKMLKVPVYYGHVTYENFSKYTYAVTKSWDCK
ncbi:hypothetical protein [Paenibacillus radicis (ex Xue et al. 2023)]|uniref:Uncharacterized protein n=1 Tax=Paenibacillus radicis (ex Xue et al. 2023) TaxID=2972489 RepID=A0ABT1YAA1_9BACL|nr:hypothetical protein [Paenibacillus radicis (ex Xue et al. 2023)]MCR8630116.1 hypothetical protein [Paenibacillus radicis (ex Xue et al. 2023)]